MTTPASFPAMPEKTVRLKEDSTRQSSDDERKRLIRNSYEAAKPMHSAPMKLNTVNKDPTPKPLELYSSTPAARSASRLQPPPAASSTGDLGLTAETGHCNYLPSFSVDQRPGHKHNGSSGKTQLNGQGTTSSPTKDSDAQSIFGGRPRQRAFSSLSQDNASVRTVLPKYTPIANGRPPPARPQSVISSRHNPWDVYDPDLEYPSSNAGTYDSTSGTPSKSKPRKQGASFYIVREPGDRDSDSDGGPPEGLVRLPFTDWMHKSLKTHFVAFLGEFVGTCMFLWFAFAGTIVANIGAQKSANDSTTGATVGFSPIVNLYVAVSFGFSLLVNVWVFFRVSGALFNPAVTLGMVMTKSIGYTRGFLLFAAQLLGATFASFLVKVMFPTNFNVRTTLSQDTSVAQGVFIEMVLTAELVFTVFMLAKEKHKATFMAPIGIGMALFIAEIVGVFFTGGSLNPARSFGPCVVAGHFDSEHWIYWVGPCCGTLVAYAFYRFIKILEYEMANPGQDHNEREAEQAESMKRAESFA